MTSLLVILALLAGWALGRLWRRPAVEAPVPTAPPLPDTYVDLRPLIDSLPDPVLLLDAGDRLALLNDAAARLLQVTPGNVLRRPFVAVTPDQTLLDLVDAVRSTGADVAAQRELRLIRAGARLTFQALAHRNADGSILLMLRDVTQLAHLVQVKSDFVSNAGHELRTPVAAIKLALETLRDDPSHLRALAIVEGQVDRLGEMLTDLLDLSRVESPDLAAQRLTVHPADLFAPLEATFAPLAAAKGIALLFETPPGSGELTSDPRLLSLILKNLLENAIKFTPAGGTVTATCLPIPDGFALAVADTGAGIAAEHQGRVFERFYQVDPARTGSSARGTGLGLAIVKHATQSLGGSIELESTPGRGTTMTCRFPAGARA